MADIAGELSCRPNESVLAYEAKEVIAMATETVKQKILQVVERLPDTAKLEAAIERLCFLAKVEEGLRQSDAGETFPHARSFVRSVDDPTDPDPSSDRGCAVD